MVCLSMKLLIRHLTAERALNTPRNAVWNEKESRGAVIIRAIRDTSFLIGPPIPAFIPDAGTTWMMILAS